jgi:hypothetical protein
MIDRNCITATNSRGRDSDETLRREADIFGHYLVKRAPHEVAISLYINALEVRPHVMSEREHKHLAFVRRHPWALGFIDAGLAMVDSTSEIRRRIYIMFSILESTPHHLDRFLPTRRKWWYSFAIGTTGVVGVCKAMIGSMLVKVIAA